MSRPRPIRPTDQPSVPAGRPLDVQAVVARYKQRLADAEEQLLLTQVALDAAEAECSDLRLQLAEAHDAAPAAGQ